MKIRSLRIQLLLMLMFVALVALGTVAVLASHAAGGAFQNYIKKYQPDDQRQLVAQILASYRKDHDAQEVQALVEQAGKTSAVRVIVIDHAQLVIADSKRQLTTKVFTLSMLLALNSNATPANIVSTAAGPPPSSTPVRIISTDSGDISFGPPPPPPDMPQHNFVTSVNNSLLETVIIVGCIAMLLTFLLSNKILKPVQALIFATSRMAQGDLSQRVQIKAQNEIGELAYSFNTMADSLEHSEQLRRNQISDVAHELRTPLTNIRGYLEALLDQVIEPDVSLITSLYEEAMLLTRLVTDLQDLTLAEADQLYLRRVPIALEGIVNNAVNGLALQAKNKNVSLYVDIPADLPLVEADPQRVGQILRNLLTNAIKHTPAEGEILVKARTIAGAVEVKVQDTGTGIEQEHLPHLFKRFYRADPSRSRATGGTGLGLAVVAQLVQAHGGSISVESQVERGTCFTFTLPGLSGETLNEMNATTAKLH